MDHDSTLFLTRTDYLRPYRGLTRDLYEFQLSRWLRWCVANQLDPLAVRRTDIERLEPDPVFRTRWVG